MGGNGLLQFCGEADGAAGGLVDEHEADAGFGEDARAAGFADGLTDHGLARVSLGKGGFDIEPVAEEGGAAVVDVDVDDGHAVAAIAEEFGQPVVVEIVPAGFFEEFEIAGVVYVAVYVEVVAAYGEVGVVWHGKDGNGRRMGCRPLVLQGLEGFAFHFAGG